MTASTQPQWAGLPADLAQEPLSITITRTFRAPRERVFEAWTRPEMMAQWRGPEGWDVLEAESEPVPGGKHRVVVHGFQPAPSPGEEPIERTGASYGVYLDVDPYSLIRLTWRADWAPGEESLVTIRLAELPNGGTQMDFTQEKFLTVQSAEGHKMGWMSAFNKLASLMER